MRTVEKRCEIRIAMRSRASARNCSKTSASARASIAAVGSSSTRMSASVAHEGARQRDLLPLAAGQFAAVLEPLAELRLVAAAAAPR